MSIPSSGMKNDACNWAFALWECDSLDLGMDAIKLASSLPALLSLYPYAISEIYQTLILTTGCMENGQTCIEKLPTGKMYAALGTIKSKSA